MIISRSLISFLTKGLGLVLAGWVSFGPTGSRTQAQQAAPAATGAAVVANIDTGRVGPPISKYLYGGFIEHGGALMYRSLWAETIDDRKFYFPITSKDAQPAAPASTSV